MIHLLMQAAKDNMNLPLNPLSPHRPAHQARLCVECLQERGLPGKWELQGPAAWLLLLLCQSLHGPYAVSQWLAATPAAPASTTVQKVRADRSSKRS
jgi:hypothetical protein